MTDLVVAHTGHVEPSVLSAARDLLDVVFAGELTDDDWEHCLGGLHALLWQDGELVGHASLVQRRLLHRGHAWRTGYVEGVAVRADRRRQGHGATMMSALEDLAAAAYELAALAATDEAVDFYAGRGWQRWRGPTSALTPGGRVRTPEDDDGVFVLPLRAAGRLDLHAELTCDWREGDVW